MSERSDGKLPKLVETLKTVFNRSRPRDPLEYREVWIDEVRSYIPGGDENKILKTVNKMQFFANHLMEFNSGRDSILLSFDKDASSVRVRKESGKEKVILGFDIFLSIADFEDNDEFTVTNNEDGAISFVGNSEEFLIDMALEEATHLNDLRRGVVNLIFKRPANQAEYDASNLEYLSLIARRDYWKNANNGRLVSIYNQRIEKAEEVRKSNNLS